MDYVTKEMIANINKQDAEAFIRNRKLPIEDMDTMRELADIAELELLCFWDHHKRRPKHRYEILDYQECQLMGAVHRVKEKEECMKISVKDSVFGKAARRLNDATPAEWDAATRAHNKPVGKSKSEADINELKASVKWSETFEDPAVQREFDEWARGVSMGIADMGTSDMKWLYEKPLPTEPTECPYGSDGTDPLMEAEKDVDHYVSGQHYNDVVPGMQYMQMMLYMLDGKSGVKAHLFGQVYKYLMRAGKKDDFEQDIRKARWYINCLVKFVQTGEIHVENND